MWNVELAFYLIALLWIVIIDNDFFANGISLFNEKTIQAHLRAVKLVNTKYLKHFTLQYVYCSLHRSEIYWVCELLKLISSSTTICINDKQTKGSNSNRLFFQSSMKGTLTRARTELNPEYLDLRPRAELNPEYWTPCTPLVSTDGPFSH